MKESNKQVLRLLVFRSQRSSFGFHEKNNDIGNSNTIGDRYWRKCELLSRASSLWLSLLSMHKALFHRNVPSCITRGVFSQTRRFHPARLHVRGSPIRVLPVTSTHRDAIVHRLHRVYIHRGHERELRTDSIIAPMTTHFGILETVIYHDDTSTYRFCVNPLRPIFFALPLKWNFLNVTQCNSRFTLPKEISKQEERLRYFRVFRNIACILLYDYFYVTQI